MLHSYSHGRLGGPEEPAPARSALLADSDGFSSAAAAQPAASQPADEWCYKDPQGVVQGPFARQDIIDWCVDGVGGSDGGWVYADVGGMLVPAAAVPGSPPAC